MGRDAVVEEQKGVVVAVCRSANKGERKSNVGKLSCFEHGLENDAHTGDWHLVSLLALESIEKCV